MMKVFDANISYNVSDFLNESLRNTTSFETANQELFKAFGIIQFFDKNEELHTLKETISISTNLVAEPDRTEYGDFQTNSILANKACDLLASKNISPGIVIEPTCGKGNFILASLQSFKTIRKVFGVEIYKPYVWETKFNIINFFLENPISHKPEISISHCSVFNFDFNQISKDNFNKEILIIGNPPWVTNSKLGSLNSSNLPRKSNIKNHSGLDAMTGKSNFDIAEYITISMLDTFQNTKGNLLFLVKNSVIKNIIFDQKKNKYSISSIEKLSIDSKKEFNVSVDASLFFCELNSTPQYVCKEFNFYNQQNHYQQFGWLKDKFVSNIDTYNNSKEIDGECPFIWRQGLKHDCSAVMELVNSNGHYLNGLNEEVELEDALVYGILKSSDLKNTVINQIRKFTIVTQQKVGQDTKYIKSEYPKTYQYLSAHQTYFDMRRSSIYNNKPSFSIFGIGDYSFKPFKVAISGLYKTFHFTLVLPLTDKAVMLDDTCYFIGFDKIEYAAFSLILLNSDKTKQFLQSVTFPDAKRTFTKDVLMRINLLELGKTIDKQYLQTEMKSLNQKYNLDLNLSCWENFINEMQPLQTGQTSMFV